MNQDLFYREVYRTLGEKIYFLRFHFIRLTQTDCLFVMSFSYLVALIIHLTETEKVVLYSFITLDPFGWLVTGLMMGLLLSLGNHLRPQGKSELVIKRLVARQILLPHKDRKDRFWIPNNSKLYLGDAHLKRINTKTKKFWKRRGCK